MSNNGVQVEDFAPEKEAAAFAPPEDRRLKTIFDRMSDGERVDVAKNLSYAASYSDGVDTTHLLVTNTSMMLRGKRLLPYVNDLV